MRCKVGVHTGGIELTFDDATWETVKGLLPGKIGRRHWYINEVGGRIEARRSKFGTVPYRHARQAGTTCIRNECETIVRCTTHERECRVEGDTLVVEMDPHHLWPWMHNGSTRIKQITIVEWRARLVAEINARVRSCVACGADFPTNVPPWASKMLSRDDWERVHRNEELPR